MPFEKPYWKRDWDRVKRHYEQWWRREGPVLTIVGLPALEAPRDSRILPEAPKNPRQRHLDPHWFALCQRAMLSGNPLAADTVPIALVDNGTLTLAACFGAEPEFAADTVWYGPREAEPDDYPTLLLSKREKWWLKAKEIMLEVLRESAGDYLVGFPAFGSNLDVLMALRGTQNLLMDLIERPGWVKEKLEEINQSFFIALDDYYEHIRLEDGSSAYTFFQIWGPGKTSQVQCDFAAMISPAMFREFVVPPLRRQCAWLDHSLFHLDGPACIAHLDHLLEIPELDAIQWTPGAGQPGAGDRKWYGLYGRILEAGKSVQILGASVEEAKRILGTFGPKGVYMMTVARSQAEAEEIIDLVDSLRPSE